MPHGVYCVQEVQSWAKGIELSTNSFTTYRAVGCYAAVIASRSWASRVLDDGSDSHIAWICTDVYLIVSVYFPDASKPFAEFSIVIQNLTALVLRMDLELVYEAQQRGNGSDRPRADLGKQRACIRRAGSYYRSDELGSEHEDSEVSRQPWVLNTLVS